MQSSVTVSHILCVHVSLRNCWQLNHPPPLAWGVSDPETDLLPTCVIASNLVALCQTVWASVCHINTLWGGGGGSDPRETRLYLRVLPCRLWLARVRPDARDRQTHRRQTDRRQTSDRQTSDAREKHRLMPPPIRGGGVKIAQRRRKQCALAVERRSQKILPRRRPPSRGGGAAKI